jgi:hypothetical protein
MNIMTSFAIRYLNRFIFKYYHDKIIAFFFLPDIRIGGLFLLVIVMISSTSGISFDFGAMLDGLKVKHYYLIY